MLCRAFCLWSGINSTALFATWCLVLLGVPVLSVLSVLEGVNCTGRLWFFLLFFWRILKFYQNYQNVENTNTDTFISPLFFAGVVLFGGLGNDHWHTNDPQGLYFFKLCPSNLHTEEACWRGGKASKANFG